MVLVHMICKEGNLEMLEAQQLNLSRDTERMVILVTFYITSLECYTFKVVLPLLLNYISDCQYTWHTVTYISTI